jgi:hypothetical protein
MERFPADSDEEYEEYEDYFDYPYQYEEHDEEGSEDEREEYEYKLEQLRRNDPSHTSGSFQLCRFSDNELSVAFQSNDYVKDIRLYLHDTEHTTNWESLLRVLATRQKLETFSLEDDNDIDLRCRSEQLTPFLLAIQQNPQVQTVNLAGLQISGESIASLLDAATS